MELLEPVDLPKNTRFPVILDLPDEPARPADFLVKPGRPLTPLTRDDIYDDAE